MGIYFINDSDIVIPPDKPEELLAPPWRLWHDDIKSRWYVDSPNKPKDALAHGIKWEEKLEENLLT